ncbi:MAG: winged helix-turn-helix domain-containing protein [Phycisphaerae bacterium]
MKKADVKVGNVYGAKVSGKVVPVRIDAENPRGGWDATNTATNKKVRIKSARRLRGPWPKKGGKGKASAKAKAAAKDATRANVGGEGAAEGDAKAAKKAKVDAWRKDVAAKVAKPDPELDKAVAAAEKDRKAKAKKAKAPREKKPSLLDLAAEVLAKAKEPMDCKTIVEKVLATGRWQTKGATPEATLYSAIIREISKKGDESRFEKVGRGQFALATTKEK